MVRFEAFNRRHGLYRSEFLGNPRMFDMVDIEFPTSSVIHYLPESDADWAPDPTWWMIRRTAGSVWVDHILQFQPFHGKTTPVTGNPIQYVRKFHQRYPSLKKVINLDTALGQATSTVVINHALARHYIKYQGTQFLEYSRNRNLRDNVFAEVGKMVGIIDRQHFIPMRMPTSFPTLGQIQKAAKEEVLSVDSVKRFMSLERLCFLEIWRWMEDGVSLINDLPKDKLTHVNFVFTVRGNWMMVNLADLAALRKSEDNPGGKYDSLALQKRFLNGLLKLVEAGVAAEKKPDALPDLDSPDEATPTEGKTNSEIQSHNEGVLNRVPVSKEISSKIEKNQPATLVNIGVDNSQGTTPLPQSVEAQVAAKEQAVQEKEASEASLNASLVGKVSTDLTDEEIDANLEALERVDSIQQGNDFAIPNNPNVDPLEEGILSRGRKMAKDGLISGSELRRIEALSTAYKKIKNPFGPGLMFEAAKVTPEELVVQPEVFNVKGPIFDESMMSSSVRVANAQYVKQTLNKDVVNVVLGFQRSGLAVTDVQLIKAQTEMGKQNILSVHWQPIGGARSTSRIILPIINEEGVFKSGGTRYRMRTQRQDVPIRVTGPGRVSLTSYAGKVNISLSEKEVHNYGRWLTDQISAMAIDKSPIIKEVHFTNVFDRSVRAPKAYTRLAHSVHTMRIEDMSLNFKYKDRMAFGTEAAILAAEKDGSVVVGLAGKELVTVAPNGEFMVAGKSRGTIEHILNLNLGNAPHQVAVIRIKGQWVPLGVAIASYTGLSNLINLLKATTRRVLAGDRMELKPYEYAVRFSDESLILDTREQLAMMLLSGFRMYHKEIRQISIYSFDSHPAYGMLLDAKSRSGAYTVELELMDESFIDSMTRDLLKEMGEPTEWRPLLLRAAELLLTDYAPDEVDGAFMLLKGYERVPGAVHRELYSATRQYKLRSRVTKASIDMKPTQVWNSFTGDSSISPVNDCNPIADLRASEAVTYIGTGGRSKRSMVARTRKFHKNDMGVISEQTVDSGEVGINIYMSANPRLVSTRGLTRPAPDADCGVSSMVSTAAMLSPGADIDDQMSN